MLDKAKNVDEALALLSSYDMHSSANSCYHFQICDASGKSVVVEYVDDEMKVVYPDKNYQCATNFLLTNPDAEFNFGQTATKLLMKIKLHKWSVIKYRGYAAFIRLFAGCT